MLLSSKPPKGTSLGESASFDPSTRFCCRQEKGKGRYTESQVGYISPIWGADPCGPISRKISPFVGVYDVIIQSNFGFSTFRGFRSTWGQNFHFPIDFAGHYNSTVTTAQPVTKLRRKVCKSCNIMRWQSCKL